MSFLQLVLSLDKTIRDLILFCRQCHSDPYRNTFIIGGIQPRVTISVIAISNSIIVTPNSKYSGQFNIGVHGKWLMRDKF